MCIKALLCRKSSPTPSEGVGVAVSVDFRDLTLGGGGGGGVKAKKSAWACNLIYGRPLPHYSYHTHNFH
jgi:hypothetical protein